MRPTSNPTMHRELFQAVGLQETVEMACSCSRGADHWYSRPGGQITAPGSDSRTPAQRTRTSPASASRPAI
ncbi:hypothetical protein [Agromyces sp. NPDC058110]|uniref:hypothetical protein n=1 Tax=Agromyces sp. NPDC058110 TaxID=3346345 RepID=UPI0036D87750